VPAEPFRCSTVALALKEPQHGTASIVRNWILIEQPGPWGPNAYMQSRLPRPVARWLRSRTAELGIRVVLLRRHGRTDPEHRRCYLAHTGATTSWVEHGVLRSPQEILDVDLSALAAGERTGFGRLNERPLYLVCTNGRRDPCCAERGRPLARTLSAAFGERVWECSHIGGDRFAGNVVCFPHGIYLGRVRPEEAVSIAQRYEEGIIDLDHYRGRSCYDFAVQSAEYFVRRRENLHRVNDLVLVKRTEGRPGEVIAQFSSPDGSIYRVRVRSTPVVEARPLTCHAAEESRPRNFELMREEV
jgi:hypothetical protein